MLMFVLQEPDIDYSANNELRKLQFYGAGPKMAVPSGGKGKPLWITIKSAVRCIKFRTNTFRSTN